MFATLVCALAGSVSASAQHHGDHQRGSGELHHTSSPHVHGAAELLIVQDGKQLEIELRSPAANLLGFEHHPKTKAQHDKLNKLSATLAEGAELFQFAPSSCQLLSHSTDLGTLDAGEQNAGDHLDDHGDHSDIKAHYRYHCGAAVQSLHSDVASRYPGLDTVRVQWVVNGRQGAATLDNSHRNVIFR